MLNSATMILLPKRADAAKPGDFRPISLVHFFAKLFSKILATRLRHRMHDLVRPCQNAFIAQRSIHDNFAFVRGQAMMFKRLKTPALLIKLDIQKAFDSISWEFLLEILQAKGFGIKWRNWIACLLRTASTRILVNGSLTDFIQHCRGLRQGDPLSPLLFVLAMDALAALFALAEERRVLRNIANLQLPHRLSLYADDVIIFANPDPAELKFLREMLHCFGEASGLFTNFIKSSYSPIQCSDIDLTAISVTLGCQMQSFPCTYLGLPLTVDRLRQIDLQPAIDKLTGKVKS
jgi:hypothetical protein